MEEKKPEETSTSLEAKPEEHASVPGAAEQGGQSPIQAGAGNPASSAGTPPKKTGIKALLRKIDIYLIGFVLLLVIGGFISAVNYFNSKKTPSAPSAVNQNLTTKDLKQLANSNASVGDTGQTVTIQGNAIFSGQVLVQSDLDVAGNIKLGGDLTAQNFTASGTANLTNTQIQTLQVAQDSTLQGTVTVQKDLNVAGAASFSGPITASQITATTLIISGNGVLQVPNHVSFNGPAPTRASFTAGVLGSGGSASVSGSDTTGTINVNTGINTNAGCFITINFHQPFASTPHIILSPVGLGAGETEYYVTRTTTNMTVCTANAAPEHQAFSFDYFVTG